MSNAEHMNIKRILILMLSKIALKYFSFLLKSKTQCIKYILYNYYIIQMGLKLKNYLL